MRIEVHPVYVPIAAKRLAERGLSADRRDSFDSLARIAESGWAGDDKHNLCLAANSGRRSRRCYRNLVHLLAAQLPAP